jgi:hypothetical protein
MLVLEYGYFLQTDRLYGNLPLGLLCKSAVYGTGLRPLGYKTPLGLGLAIGLLFMTFMEKGNLVIRDLGQTV